MYNFNPVKLIDEVKKRPGLYNNSVPVDREEKLTLWKEVGAALYDKWETFNKATAYDRVLHLQRKWRSLKDAYNRELRARKSGVRRNRRVYIYFKRMSFLGGFDGEISEEDDLISSDMFLEHQNSMDDDPLVNNANALTNKKSKPKKRRKQPSSEETAEEIEMELPTFPVEMTGDNESDSDRLFMLSFLPEMRQLPVNIKMWARAQIANIMQEAVSCHYNNTRPGVSGEKSCSIDVKRQRMDSSE